MKINEQLVKKVQDREACIEHTLKDYDLHYLQQLLCYTFPTDSSNIRGIFVFYCASKQDKGMWSCKMIRPSGMTPIPLKDFFVEEVEEKENGVTLENLPSGSLFTFNGTTCLKSEYRTDKGAIEAYIVGSGEMFWGGTNNAEDLNNLLVTEIKWTL